MKRNVHIYFSLALFIGLLPLSLLGQGNQTQPGLGYFFFAPGIRSCEREGTFHVGGGGEVSLAKGLGVGAEIGYLSSWKSAGSGIGILSLDGVYQFHRSRKTVPFVLAGYSLGFRSGVAHALNFGGGVNYWFREKVGLRLEFRDHIPTSEAYCHFLGFRLGLSFR
jgi:hypothetical protein